MSDIIRRDPRAEWIARNRLHPLHAAMQPVQHSWMGPNGVIRKNPHGIGFIGPNGIKRIDRSGAQQGGATKRSAAVEVQLPLHQVAAPAFYISVVPDMVGGRLSSHDRDLLGLAHQLAGKDGAVLAVVFGEHKENAFATAGVDRLLVLEGDEFSGYAPEQRVQGLRAVDNQFSPRHWLLPDSRSGGGELGRRFAAALGERPATRVWQVKDQECIGRAGAGLQDLARPVARLILAAAECAEPVSETRWSYPQRSLAACRGSKIWARWRWTRRRFRWPKPSSSSLAATVSRTGDFSTGRPKRWARPKVRRGWRWTMVSWRATVRSARPAPG
jgi:electron transfer flavoprotein alpha subunit